MIVVLHVVLVAMVLSGATVLIVGCMQFLLAGLHVLSHPYHDVGEIYPNVAVVIPAWNEAAVLENTIDRMMALEYPRGRLRLYVVDDASTDETPSLMARKMAEYAPGAVHHLRRAKGGEGKAHTINHGLREILADDWAEAILITDADVIFTDSSVRRMARHLVDPKVGAVTCYIKEGSRPANYMNRFVGFEYITAQAAARRAQNVLGAQACLAGGAQLIARGALEEIGGTVDTTSLAEDTFTTFNIQLAGYKVKFDGNAVVWAEEPRAIVGLWKQRQRWSRGNFQVTVRFRHVWLRPSTRGRLGSIPFAAIWFSIVFMPLFIVMATTGLVTLFFIDRPLAIEAFKALWALTGFTYLFVTFSSLLLDTETARRCWREGILFPGLINLFLIMAGLFGPILAAHLNSEMRTVGLAGEGLAPELILLAADLWLTFSMIAAYGLKKLEEWGRVPRLVPPLMYVIGYGPLLCTITVAAFLQEVRGEEMRWDKTEKTGNVGKFA